MNTNLISESKINWVICYDGVLQHRKRTSKTQEEAVLEAKKVITRLKNSVKNGITKIYPDESKWELMIWE